MGVIIYQNDRAEEENRSIQKSGENRSFENRPLNLARSTTPLKKNSAPYEIKSDKPNVTPKGTTL
jgi:hypothetical protein